MLKGNVPPRPALDAYLIDRYREFVSGLLDVTDNIVDGKVLHPPEVVRHDGDDPYLVVAADKGTAHLSDTANSVSAQYGFWLGDAFASGGSVGLRPQEDGHHRARRLGVREAPLPQPGPGHPEGAVHDGGHRRHVGRRVRQRRAALARDAAGGRLQPRPHLHRPRSRPGEVLRGARAAVPAAALHLARLRRRRSSARAAASSTARPRPSRSRRRCGRCSTSSGDVRLGRGGHPPHPHRAGRPALQRRHRHLREGATRRTTPTWATAPTTACAWTAARCARAWWARAATWASPSAAGSST